MATQNEEMLSASRATLPFTSLTDAMRLASEKAVASHREVVDLALSQAKENTDALF